MITRFKIKKSEINRPNNAPGIEIERNFDADESKQAVSINGWEFGIGDGSDPKDGYTIIKKYIEAGLTGGTGVFEGLPLEIELDDEKGTKYNIFDGIIDTSKAKVACGEIEAPSIASRGIDSLETRARGISPAYLESIGKITKDNYIPVPYIVEEEQDALKIAVAFLTFFVVGDKFRESIAHVQESIGRLASPFSASEVLALVARIVYMLSMFILVTKLVIDIVTMLLQFVKYHMTMYATETLEIGLAHLGLTLSSSILQSFPHNIEAILPEKFQQNTDNTGIFEGLLGFSRPNGDKQDGYYKKNYLELLASLKKKYNAKILVVDNVAHFEKRDFFVKDAEFTIPRHEFWEDYEFNEADIKTTYDLRFAWDSQDRHTIQEFSGTAVTVETKPAVVDDPANVLSDGITNIQLEFALAKRKTKLTFVEKIVKGFLDVISAIVNVLILVVNAVLKVINAITRVINKIIKALGRIGIRIKNPIRPIPLLEKVDFGKLIEDRIGMLKMESDFVNVPKIMMIPNNSNPRTNTLHPDNETVVNALYLWNNYHYFESPVAQNGWHGNQYKLKSFDNEPFCFADDEAIKDNNNIFDADGAPAELLTLKFNPEKGTANGSYKVPYIYTKNLTETIIIPDGK